MKLLITNIQRFCVHDGPGIRTTIFLKGCNLHCPWCSNPENIHKEKQFFYNQDKCIGVEKNCAYGKCRFSDHVVTKQKLEHLTKEEISICKSGALGVYGIEKDINTLYNELLEDEIFWKIQGGVTFSGGEPLLQIKPLEKLLVLLKEKGIDIAIETALFVSENNIQRIMPYVDHWLVDIKLMDKNDCLKVIGGNIDIYLKNLDYLICEGGRDIWLRHPDIEGYTDGGDNLKKIESLRNNYHCLKYQVIPGHYLGEKKYLSLGMNLMKETNY